MAPILPFILVAVAGIASAGVKIASAVENRKFINEQKGIERRRLADRLAEDRRRFALIAGQQEAGFASSGLELSGTPLDVLGDTMVQRARNEAALRLESKQRIAGLNNQASQQGQAIAGGIIGGISSVAGAAAGAFDAGLLGGGSPTLSPVGPYSSGYRFP